MVGIDLDPESLRLAKENAIQHKYNNVEFYKKNAWELGGESGEYDLITSNGLNIYEPDDAKVVQLYRKFYKKLKVDGVLVTSFLTPPPVLSTESSWKKFNPADALKHKVIFSDIIGVSWQAFRTEAQTRAQLEAAGFSVVEVVYDTQGMFPTIVAKKQS